MKEKLPEAIEEARRRCWSEVDRYLAVIRKEYPIGCHVRVSVGRSTFKAKITKHGDRWDPERFEGINTNTAKRRRFSLRDLHGPPIDVPARDNAGVQRMSSGDRQNLSEPTQLVAEAVGSCMVTGRVIRAQPLPVGLGRMLIQIDADDGSSHCVTMPACEACRFGEEMTEVYWLARGAAMRYRNQVGVGDGDSPIHSSRYDIDAKALQSPNGAWNADVRIDTGSLVVSISGDGDTWPEALYALSVQMRAEGMYSLAALAVKAFAGFRPDDVTDVLKRLTTEPSF